MILRAGAALGILPDTAALHLLQLLDEVQVNAGGIVDIARRVGHGDHLSPHLGSLLAGVDGHVAGAGDHHGGAVEAPAVGTEHVVREVAEAIARGLLPGEASAVAEALAGEDAGKLVAEALILTEEVADLPAAHADVPGGDVGIRADVLEKLRHEALAEAHDLGVRLALGVKVAAALAATDGEAGEAVLEDLLEAQELDDAEVHRGVEAQAALVGADGAVELHPVTPVHVDAAGVIHPGHPELDAPLRLHQAVHDALPDKLRPGLHHGLQGLQHLVDGLQKLRLGGVTGRETQR